MNIEAYHLHTQQQLRSIIARLPHGVIFVGPAGVGKMSAATYVAEQMNATSDALVVITPENLHRPVIKLAQIHDAINSLTLKPLLAEQHRVVVIAAADSLTDEAANALLKLLEEPPPATHIILLVHSVSTVLPTIRSRAQIIRFLPNSQAKPVQFAGIDPAANTRLNTIGRDLPARLKLWQVDDGARIAAAQLAEQAENFIEGDLTEQFAIAKTVHDNKNGVAFLQFLFRLSPNLQFSQQLLAAEFQLNNNLNPRLVFEHVALELT